MLKNLYAKFTNIIVNEKIVNFLIKYLSKKAMHYNYREGDIWKKNLTLFIC